MAGSFDTKRFIQEVEKRPELWNTKLKITREEQHEAWHSLGDSIFSNWRLCPNEIREERVKEMKILWNNIEDKYFQEITANNKGKKADRYAKLLTFLKTSMAHENDQKKVPKTGGSGVKRKSTAVKKKKEENTSQKNEDEDEEESEEDGDESFFKSLLPAVRSLSEHQKMDLRLDILHSMKKIMGNPAPKRKSSAGRSPRQAVEK